MKTTHGMVLCHAKQTVAEVINLAVTFDSDLNPIRFTYHIASTCPGKLPKGNKCNNNYCFEQSLNNHELNLLHITIVK